MAHLNGLLLIDAPASALNNAGSVPGDRTDNKVTVKYIRTRSGAYPYVSAQAFRYWLRNTLEQSDLNWQAAPIYRESKVAYPDANPIIYWDDDLFGYMRAPSKKVEAVEAREGDESQKQFTEVEGTITRVSPFKVSTLVSVGPVNLTEDFGVMSRHDGDPVPHEHQFYRTTLKGLFGLDLRSAGTFWHRAKTGYRNLDEHRRRQAQERNLEEYDSGRAYRLPLKERVERIRSLLQGMALLDGGAKQTLHYTNVAPSFVICAVTKGGNNPFGHVVTADPRGEAQVNAEALEEALEVYSDQLLSPVYVGWAKGFMEGQRTDVEAKVAQRAVIAHPRRVFERLADDFAKSENASWLD
ncbi:type I-B CRISPR-associated protein Cas7/Cst2/DevR [Rubrobacter xylanophilus]|uniref:Type I-B CRISPR-associated protein Cas7/Cst2/DevR n=1 Tax=Rubrobacter xylanophilus TaxID=49319 RepID=A0A510HIN3_9ACTN|nr:type I-B CRISPR-associated protein Cas7/Cst2/DevR [Rubrobacter xylanophilus]BBL79856.1 type I-B CRISPR-associated protein Cas7/Cst2/DevR [Rubrobacter xylanophilus]